MENLIRELRRREVFRTAGLYVGVCWILIEAAATLLPAFGVADWVLQGLIYIAVIGFPIIVVLAWFFDISEEGIAFDDSAKDDPVPHFGERKTDFVVIALLAVALAFSVFLNATRQPETAAVPRTAAIAIAIFENRTGDPVFDRTLEALVSIALESSPQVAVHEPGDTGNPSAGSVVLQGAIERDGSSFVITLEAMERDDDNTILTVTEAASDGDDVIRVVQSLGRSVRAGLGLDAEPDSERKEATLTGSLQAAAAWANGRRLASRGDVDNAILSFRRAIDADPEFGHAHASLALLQFRSGQGNDGAVSWDRALQLLDTLTERERLKLLGMYHLDVAGDDLQALAYFSELLEKFPTEIAARRNVARAAFGRADFTTAFDEAEQVLAGRGGDRADHLQLARYARYAGVVDRALAVSESLVADDPQDGAALLQLALAELATGRLDEARESLLRLADNDAFATEAALGLADLDTYRGRFEPARQALEAHAGSASGEQQETAALARLALADAWLAAGDRVAAAAAARSAADMDDRVRTRIAAALALVEAGEPAAAAQLAEQLRLSPRSTERAWGMTITAAVLRQDGQHLEAIDTLRQAMTVADLWRSHLELGRVYIEAGMVAEAFSELRTCQKRRGEAVALYLDDVPTLRYWADLHYWLGRAEEALGMSDAASRSFLEYLALRPEGGAYAKDAALRVAGSGK